MYELSYINERQGYCILVLSICRSVTTVELRMLTFAQSATIIAIFIVVGLVGNSCVIYIYMSKKKIYKGNIYIVTFAVLDILALVLLLPFYLDVDESIERNTFLGRFFYSYAIFNYIAYILLLAAMALDRVHAVFYPFSYATSKQVRYSLVMVFLLTVTCTVGGNFSQVFGLLGVTIVPSVVLCVLVVCYTKIIWKLVKQKNSVRSTAHAMVTTSRTAVPHQNQRQEEQRQRQEEQWQRQEEQRQKQEEQRQRREERRKQQEKEQQMPVEQQQQQMLEERQPSSERQLATHEESGIVLPPSQKQQASQQLGQSSELSQQKSNLEACRGQKRYFSLDSQYLAVL